MESFEDLRKIAKKSTLRLSLFLAFRRWRHAEQSPPLLPEHRTVDYLIVSFLGEGYLVGLKALVIVFDAPPRRLLKY